MRNPTSNSNQFSPVGQKPNTDPRLSLLTIDELCQSFVDHHCGKPPRPDLARPYLVELLRRQEAAETEQDNSKPNDLYFKALNALSNVRAMNRIVAAFDRAFLGSEVR